MKGLILMFVLALCAVAVEARAGDVRIIVKPGSVVTTRIWPYPFGRTTRVYDPSTGTTYKVRQHNWYPRRVRVTAIAP